MAVTRLKRKHRKNIARANNRQRVIKQLLATPVIKNVDVEELKAQFGESSGANVTDDKPTTSTNNKSEANVGAQAPKAAADTKNEDAGIFSRVTDAISDAASTVVDKVEDVVEAVKDRVEDITSSDENKEEDKSAK